MKKIFVLLMLASCLLMAAMFSCEEKDHLAKYLDNFKNSDIVKNKFENINTSENKNNFVDKDKVAILPEIPSDDEDKKVEITEDNKYVTQKNVPPKVDGNGVLIEKKDGVITTKFPNGENYYIPDEL